MSASAYNCKHPRGVMSVSKGKPKPSKVLKSGSAKSFLPGASQKAWSSSGGRQK